MKKIASAGCENILADDQVMVLDWFYFVGDEVLAI